MNAPADILFETQRFGAATLRNRIVMAPMTRKRSPAGVPTDEVAAYYRRRGEGGAGRGGGAEPSREGDRTFGGSPRGLHFVNG